MKCRQLDSVRAGFCTFLFDILLLATTPSVANFELQARNAGLLCSRILSKEFEDRNGLRRRGQRFKWFFLLCFNASGPSVIFQPRVAPPKNLSASSSQNHLQHPAARNFSLSLNPSGQADRWPRAKSAKVTLAAVNIFNISDLLQVPRSNMSPGPCKLRRSSAYLLICYFRENYDTIKSTSPAVVYYIFTVRKCWCLYCNFLLPTYTHTHTHKSYTYHTLP